MARHPVVMGLWGPVSILSDYREGVCAEGADFLCGDRNGIYSCRPCNYPQLAVFKDLQTQINRLVRAYGLSSSLLLDVDGRIGPLTVKSLAAVSQRVRSARTPPAALASAMDAATAGSGDAMRKVATVGTDLRDYLREGADAAGAPQTTPTPSPVPLPGGGSGIGPVPPEGRAAGVAGAGIIVTGLAVVATAGLVGAALYYKRRRRRA